ncbi:HD-GYP domain-containing protein [Marinobacterium sp. D7]|uniref:HD-GYP domain-containing protein n=1 Tax=Marinobacterium ramblicola TaxID=2849041 RepID=UPI001C2D9853|nr:HD-GYP domain-containing protein [Marinobacterium ramblicola]MBV1790664.1 HD-GYP domain-containing protein [Marinobacterium ramblicola]
MIFRRRKQQPQNPPTPHAGQLMQSLLAMAWFVEARDPYTGGHLWRVGRLAWLLADAAGMSPAETARVSLGGFLHDLGKVGVPDEILRKPGSLSDEEYAVIKTHPSIGMRMLAGHPLMHLAADAVGKHHERPDGRGYPAGLSGAEIPMDARIVAICDAFDAMTSHRPYRAGMPIERALSIIDQEAGKQFDAELAATFVELGRAGQFECVVGHSDDGIPLQECPMCGPTVVVRKEQKPGEHLYCRNCGGEFELKLDQSRLVALPTGNCGAAADLEPDADHALIARAIEQMTSVLPLEELIAR